ncbi:DNA polymerase-3 subunit epsilon [Salirhabdus euzebyi]|uniref:DNA polymerase-3 subunit epsilon n=1 Tax=Salirhabdus euzebyi TaxID=394506 RepID=A0A841Q7U2_9BACI|nr:exonuclease domain-containing protein [Salirhabdus euzebyi]MBB6454466.1 DNA polymerase-3 subunit epsilon [Salirhabdus euzebyi]
MVMNQMMQFVRQISGRLTSNSYTSLDPQQIAYIRSLQREIKKNDVLNIPFEELKVVVFDIETTGFYPYKGDRMLTIGAVKMRGDQILAEDTFYSAIYSDEGPSKEIEKLTGITKAELLAAPPIQNVLKEFYQFVKSDTLVAHHSSHEKQFMKHANWLALKTDFQNRIIDTSFLTKIIEPELKLFTLDEYCDHFGIFNQQRHHALHDAIATANLWSEGIRGVKQLGYSHLNDVYTHIAKIR